MNEYIEKVIKGSKLINYLKLGRTLVKKEDEIFIYKTPTKYVFVGGTERVLVSDIFFNSENWHTTFIKYIEYWECPKCKTTYDHYPVKKSHARHCIDCRNIYSDKEKLQKRNYMRRKRKENPFYGRPAPKVFK